MSGHAILTKELFADALYIIPDPGDEGEIKIDRNFGIVPLVTAAAETRTLAAPHKAGLRVTLAFQTDVGDCVVTVATAVNEGGNTILTFANAGEAISLESIAVGTVFAWRVSWNDGVSGVTASAQTIDNPRGGVLSIGDTFAQSVKIGKSPGGIFTEGKPIGQQGTLAADPADTTSLTEAQVLSGILVCTPTATKNYQSPTGTEIETALELIVGPISLGDYFDLTVINIGSAGDIITMTVDTGVTFVGSVTIDDPGADVNSSGTFRYVRGASNVFVAYRIA